MNARPPRILYVQYDDDIREIISVFLEEMGYAVIAASTGAEGLALAGNIRFDFYLIDRWLPDGRGIELCRKLRSIRPDTPALLTSGFDSYIERRETFATGANRYIIKPADPFELEQAISRLIREQSMPLKTRSAQKAGSRT
jgi:two-component system, OmpR family, response regulator